MQASPWRTTTTDDRETALWSKKFKTERKSVLTFEGKRKSPWRGTDRIRSKGLKSSPAGVRRTSLNFSFIWTNISSGCSSTRASIVPP